MPSRGLLVATIQSRAARGRNEAVDLAEIQEVIDGLVEQVALIACDGTILAVNKHWARQVERQARHGLHISRDYIGFLEGLAHTGDHGASSILQAFKDIAAGSRRSFRCIYNGTGAFAGYDFKVAIATRTVHDTPHVLVSVHDITELVKLKRQRRRLGGELLRAQEDERRRIARELHDSTSQLLVSLQLNLARLGHENTSPECAAILGECKETLREMHDEIRAFSFLAHPPSLSTYDLTTALEHLISGFAARSGLEIGSDLDTGGEIPASVEAAIYRVSQEALTNIYRHSGAKRAFIRLISREHHLHLVIRDEGTGFQEGRDASKSTGVGVMGMRERVRELGGRLSIRPVGGGTVLKVTFPREKRIVFAPLIGAR
jgi:two-component system, NarL family, sensor kinase